MAGRILYLGHSTVLVDLDGVRLLTDPLLRPRVMHLRRAVELDTAGIGEVDAVLVSHLHFDHLHLPSLQLLGREVTVVVPRGAGGLLKRKKFTSVIELAVGEELRIGALAVRGTPASHDSRRLPFGARAEPMGHVIEGTRTVYFAGDTDVFDGMEALGPVDVALVPIWGWGPSLGPGHMDPTSAAEAVRMLRPSIAIPIHWGTYAPIQARLRGRPAFLESPAQNFADLVRERTPEVEVRVLQPGEQTTL